MDHLTQIAGKLDEHGLDAMLIVSEPGERYAVGFLGEGYVLVTRGGAQYSTDGRYIEAAQKQVTGAEVVLTSRAHGHLELARDYIQTHGLQRVGFESGRVSVDQHRRWQEALPCDLIPAQGLLDGLRASKDEGELAAMRRAQKITDEAFSAILDFLRPGLTEQEVAARLVYELLRRGAKGVLRPHRGRGGQRLHAPRGAGRDGDRKRDVRHHGLRLHRGRLLLRHDPHGGGGAARGGDGPGV